MSYEVTQRNILAMKAYGEETRKLLRESEEKVSRLEGIVLTNNETIKTMQAQIGILLSKLYNGGATS